MIIRRDSLNIMLIKPAHIQLTISAFILSIFIGPAVAESNYHAARQELIRTIKHDVVLTSLATGKLHLETKVLDAINTVPRHKFVPPHEAKHAYENRPLSIGYGQTISQPYIVALMTDLLDVKPGDKILEIGTGSGYQAAVLAELTRSIYTIEIIKPLGKQAAKRLKELAYDYVQTRIGDGYYGWKEAAPFDSIIVTAAASHVPPPLIEQLKPGGRMVIPVGSHFMTQQLMVVEKRKDGKVRSRQILPVAFVPLTGKH